MSIVLRAPASTFLLVASILVGCTGSVDDAVGDEEPGDPLGGTPADEARGDGEGSDQTSAPLTVAKGWTSIPNAPIRGREGAATAWTGRRFVVWGGSVPEPIDDARVGRRYFGDGAALDPATGRWSTVAKSPLGPRSGAISVWSGRRLYVLFGETASYARTTSGASYDPVTDRWWSIARAPFALHGAKGVWSQATSELVVFGHRDGKAALLAYAPSRGWRSIAVPAELGARDDAIVTRAGSEILIFGGVVAGAPAKAGLATGWSFDPATDRFRAMPSSPRARVLPNVVIETARGFAVVGGYERIGSPWLRQANALVYDHPTRTWSTTPEFPSARDVRFGSSGWAEGEDLVFWGGWAYGDPEQGVSSSAQRSGLRFDRTTRTWTRFSGGPSARIDAVAAWTGSAAIVWGGRTLPDDTRVDLADGAVYRRF